MLYVGLNGICQMSGNFYEGRSAKFWYVLSKKMVVIFAAEWEFFDEKTCFTVVQSQMCV